MARRFSRQLTPTERVYLVNAELSPPFANQIIFEGTGEFKPEHWRKAVEVASAANPGSRLVLKGSLCFARWTDSGKTPPVREVDGSRWSGMDPEGAPFLA
ncbi:MAG TPA: peptide synthetase, partial [Spirochaetota bacterium]|nr:peptide synthetase [Spirochaetota bacterium]